MSTSVSDLPPEHLDDLDYVIGLAPPGQPYELDLSDERQHRFFMGQLRLMGASEEASPQLFRTLSECVEEQRARGGPQAARAAKHAPDARAVQTAGDTAPGLIDQNVITSFGLSSSQQQSLSSALSSIVNGTVYTNLLLQLFDAASGNLLGSASVGPVYGEGEYEPLSLTGSPPGSQGMRSVFTYSYQTAPGTAPVNGFVHFTTSEVPVGPPSVTQPVRLPSHSGNTVIKVGLGRDPQHTPVGDLDYYYLEPNIENPNIRLPMVGSQKFASNITTPLFSQTGDPQNIITTILMSKETGGSANILPAQNLNLQNYIKVSATDPTTLTWAFPWNSNLSLDQSLQFGPAAWARDSNLLLTFSIAVRTATSGVDYVPMSIYSATAPPYSPDPGAGGNGIYVLRPVWYTWHCVAEGTQVTLADGTTADVERVTGGERVRTDARGSEFTVVDTFVSTKEGEVVVLRTEHGHELLVTPMHGVVTREGYVPAQDLVPGDVVATDRGESVLESVERRAYTGKVYGLGLGATEEEQARFTDDNTNYFANGILIADNRLSILFRRSYTRRLETILRRLPPEWHDEARRNYAAQAARPRYAGVALMDALAPARIPAPETSAAGAAGPRP